MTAPSTRRLRLTGGGGRDVARLLADFDHDLPVTPTPPPQTEEAGLFSYAARRGPARRGKGWAAAKAPVSATATK